MNKEQIISLLKYELGILNKITKIEDNLNKIFNSDSILIDNFFMDSCNYEILKLILEELKLEETDDILKKYYQLYINKKPTIKLIEKFYNYLKDYNEKKTRIRK